MKLNDKVIKNFARARVDACEYFGIADAIASDPKAQEKLKRELAEITDADERMRVSEIHEALGIYNQRFHSAFVELFGVDLQKN